MRMREFLGVYVDLKRTLTALHKDNQEVLYVFPSRCESLRYSADPG
jgi:hypothetical protein